MHDDDTAPVGIAICGGCGTRTDVYTTDQGLRCGACQDAPVEPYATYTPELRDFEDTRGEEMAANVEEFNESLPDIGFDVQMQDGSTWEMDKFDAHAVFMKYGDDWDAFLPALAREVAKHYERETEPTRFGGRVGWGGTEHDDSKPEYDTHAELAPVVAYPDLRAAKMQLGLMALSGDDEDPVTVLGLGDGEISQYGEFGRVTIEYTEPDDADDDWDFGGEN